MQRCERKSGAGLGCSDALHRAAPARRSVACARAGECEVSDAPRAAAMSSGSDRVENRVPGDLAGNLSKLEIVHPAGLDLLGR